MAFPFNGKAKEAYISAYAIAVKHGFVGTEEEWLESLRGASVDFLFEGGVLYYRPMGSDEEWQVCLTLSDFQGDIVSLTLAEAELARAGAMAARDEAEGFSEAAENSKNEAEDAAEKSEGFKDASEEAAHGADISAGLADEAAQAAILAKKEAIEAADASESAAADSIAARQSVEDLKNAIERDASGFDYYIREQVKSAEGYAARAKEEAERAEVVNVDIDSHVYADSCDNKTESSERGEIIGKIYTDLNELLAVAPHGFYVYDGVVYAARYGRYYIPETPPSFGDMDFPTIPEGNDDEVTLMSDDVIIPEGGFIGGEINNNYEYGWKLLPLCDDELSDTSTNPVENRVITAAYNEAVEKFKNHSHKVSELENDAGFLAYESTKTVMDADTEFYFAWYKTAGRRFASDGVTIIEGTKGLPEEVPDDPAGSKRWGLICTLLENETVKTGIEMYYDSGWNLWVRQIYSGRPSTWKCVQQMSDNSVIYRLSAYSGNSGKDYTADLGNYRKYHWCDTFVFVPKVSNLASPTLKINSFDAFPIKLRGKDGQLHEVPEGYFQKSIPVLVFYETNQFIVNDVRYTTPHIFKKTVQLSEQEYQRFIEGNAATFYCDDCDGLYANDGYRIGYDAVYVPPMGTGSSLISICCLEAEDPDVPGRLTGVISLNANPPDSYAYDYWRNHVGEIPHPYGYFLFYC